MRKRKSSLLAAGIKSVSGEFKFGDVVEITDPSGELIGRGLANYSSAQTEKICGVKSNRIEDILGSKPYDEVVHRDNLVLF